VNCVEMLPDDRLLADILQLHQPQPQSLWLHADLGFNGSFLRAFCRCGLDWPPGATVFEVVRRRYVDQGGVRELWSGQCGKCLDIYWADASIPAAYAMPVYMAEEGDSWRGEIVFTDVFGSPWQVERAECRPVVNHEAESLRQIPRLAVEGLLTLSGAFPAIGLGRLNMRSQGGSLTIPSVFVLPPNIELSSCLHPRAIYPFTTDPLRAMRAGLRTFACPRPFASSYGPSIIRSSYQSFRAPYLNEPYSNPQSMAIPAQPPVETEVTVDDLKAVLGSLHDDDAKIDFNAEGGFRYRASRQ